MKKKQIRLYNVLFPVWMLVTMPVIWYIVIPGNFIIDSLVLILALKALKVENRKSFYKKHIFLVFGFGFLSDILASLPMGRYLWGQPVADRSWCGSGGGADLCVQLFHHLPQAGKAPAEKAVPDPGHCHRALYLPDSQRLGIRILTINRSGLEEKSVRSGFIVHNFSILFLKCML